MTRPELRLLRAATRTSHNDREAEWWQLKDREEWDAQCVSTVYTPFALLFVCAYNAGHWQMSGEEPCVRGAVSDRLLCLALSVTSGTQRPLGSAGVSNYMLLSFTHTHTHTHTQTHTDTHRHTHTLHDSQCQRMMGWYSAQCGKQMLNNGGHRWSLIKLVMNMIINKIILFYVSKKTMSLNIVDPRVQSIN